MTNALAWGPSRIRALVFDFDGLICDTEGAQVRAVSEVFAHYDARLPIDKWTEVIGTAAAEDFWVPWLEDQVTTVDSTVVLDHFNARNHAHVSLLGLNDGVMELLEGAAQHNVPVAIASSSPTDWVYPLVRRFGIQSRFETIVCREHAARAKPAPDLYLEALRRLGIDREHASSVVALEDSRNGSLAAKAAGLTCIAIPHELTNAQDFSHVDHRVTSVSEIRLDASATLTVSSRTH